MRSLVREDPFSGENRPRAAAIDRDLHAVITDAQSRDWSADRPDRVIFARLGQARRRVRAAAGRGGADRRPADPFAVLLGAVTGLLTATVLLLTGIPAKMLPPGDLPPHALPSGNAPAPAPPAGNTPSPAQPADNAPSPAPPAGNAPSPAQPADNAPSPAQPAGNAPSPAQPAGDVPANAMPAGDVPAPADVFPVTLPADAVPVIAPLPLALTAVAALWTALLAVALLRHLRRRWDRATVDGPAPIDDHYRYVAFRRRIEACAAAARHHRSHRRRAAAIDLEYALDWLAAAQSELPRH
ncbi:hypothetical protein BC793_102617 [Actinoplanes xinjiangensis]|uniref:Uncharacterized protein n=2 Tax=Actinoplanes xinjiangensis TaxID=512350 RepID=A0A316FS46_9ACTN|nr:hypothetical protein BC793_102617 [Actinoplanes xinjiangensis]GIF35942.1 hypothetical protein Axi01nite_02530 [Actinoplanes xinjiangensis]